jgi:hypothetical protein
LAHYVVGRYYDPMTGQFLSVDPMVQQTQQAYVYVEDDPVHGTDPNGQDLVGVEGGSAGFNCQDNQATGPCVPDYWPSQGFGWGFLSNVARVGKWVIHDARTLSTVASVLAVVAYIACPETGITCGLGLVLSYASTGMDVVSAASTCSRAIDHNCGIALASVALDALSGVAAWKVSDAWSKAVAERENLIRAGLYVRRQRAVIGAVFSALSAAQSAVG